MEKHIATSTIPKGELKMAILISEKIGFKSQIITSAKEGHFTMIKDSVLLEDTPLQTCMELIREPPNTKLKGENSTVQRDFNLTFDNK